MCLWVTFPPLSDKKYSHQHEQTILFGIKDFFMVPNRFHLSDTLK